MKRSYIYHILDDEDEILYVGHIYQKKLTFPLEEMDHFIKILEKLPESNYTIKITHTFLINKELALLTFKYLEIRKLEKDDLYKHNNDL